MSRSRTRAARCLALAAALFAPIAARANEGYWLFSAPPLRQVAADTGVSLSRDWLLRLQRATARAGTAGTSGAFVSSGGLLLTARHVIPASLRATIQRTLDEGFAANQPSLEIPLPGLTADQVLEERDITRELAAIQRLEREATRGPGRVAQTVSLHGGAKHVLYVYHRYHDLRLVFAPETALAAAGTPYPAPALDIALLRVYEHGKPARTPNFLPLAQQPPHEGEPVFVSGAPYAGSWRQVPAEELDAMREIDIPVVQQAMSKAYARLAVALDAGPTPSVTDAAVLARARFYRELLEIAQRELADPQFAARRHEEEGRLRAGFTARQDTDGLRAFEDIAAAQAALRPLRAPHALIPWSGSGDPVMWQGPDADLPWGAYLVGTPWTMAQVLLREREERARPDAARSSGYRNADRRALEHWLLDGPCDAGCPMSNGPAVEQALLGTFLESLTEHLPAGDPLVAAALGGLVPRERAARLLAATRLGDASFRRMLYLADDAQFAQAKDPMLDLLRALQPELRRRGTQFDAAMTRLRAAAERVAAASYRLRGDALYPETSGTPRFGYGVIAAYDRAPADLTMDPTPWYRLPGIATLAHLREHAHRAGSPLQLPSRWVDAMDRLPPDTPVDFLTTVDGVAGSSGSVTVNAAGEVVGVLFGGIAGGAAFQYVYEGKLREPDRSTHAAAGVLIPALRQIYGAPLLAEELREGIVRRHQAEKNAR